MPMALASRTPTPEVAEAFLKKLAITHYFDSIQLIPASSGYDQVSAQKDTAHFPNIQRQLGIDYSRMLFFDDEHKNVTKVGLQPRPWCHVGGGLGNHRAAGRPRQPCNIACTGLMLLVALGDLPVGLRFMDNSSAGRDLCKLCREGLNAIYKLRLLYCT